MDQVFVYGTLKTGQPNNFRMRDRDNGRAEFVAHARTVKRYPLVIATEENIPFLLNVAGTGQRIQGEIYSVDQKMLDFLDEFEECPKLYQRTTVQLVVQDGVVGGKNTLESGSIVEAFMYSTTTYEPEWLQKPTYESYEANGDHGLRYVIVSVFPAVHMDQVFVYGTLKKGQPNYFRMMDPAKGQAEFVAHARTVERYPLVIATKYNIPFLLNVAGTGHRIQGEIYSVDQKMLDFLDQFEKCPKLYQRTTVQLEVQDGVVGGKTRRSLEVSSRPLCTARLHMNPSGSKNQHMRVMMLTVITGCAMCVVKTEAQNNYCSNISLGTFIRKIRK
ncbi:Gamma-glutamylaminecyclotransferase B [Anabarilius grahami]|uniref:Gamma-glutamylaminecyclotransferase n=1 Tax=Anabarilius grahami TaxID=495550 RepID=A0A3N0XNM3_ANAGA|nr:Gamma-glutamylaminecyclotransferase B [Anabarilius grahami]